MKIDLKRVYIAGNGKPLLILHGMGGLAPVIELAKDLSNNYKVIAPTMPGFLLKDGIIHYHDSLYIDFLESLAEKLRIDQWNVVGYSMGGRTALNYTFLNTQKISKLVLIDSVGVNYMNPLLRFKIGKEFFSFIMYHALNHTTLQRLYGKMDFCRTDTDIFKKSLNEFRNMISNKTMRKNFSNILPIIGSPIPNLIKSLSSLETETLLLWAKEDKTAPLSWGQELHKSLKNSKLEILTAYKHMGIVEKRDFFHRHIIEFLKI